MLEFINDESFRLPCIFTRERPTSLPAPFSFRLPSFTKHIAQQQASKFMATSVPGRSHCVTCGKDNKATLRCGGCLQEYCFNHLTDHRQGLSKQLDEIEVARDLFKQTLSQQTAEPEKHAL